MIDSLRQVQVVSALARLAGHGGWARILLGKPLEHDADLADARLLVAAGVLRERPDGELEPVDLHPWYDDPEILASGLVGQLRRALEHAEGGRRETGVDQDEIRSMGVASRSVAAILAEAVLPMLPGTRDRLVAGTARFLDVGVGTGAIADTLCQEFPGITAVGLDVSPEALTFARQRLRDSAVADRVELRRQSVVDLADQDAYDLAWLPQVFLSPADLEPGLRRVHRALRSGCWLVMPVAASGPDCTGLERAALEHDALLRGGGPLSVVEATRLLTAAGFAEIWDMPGVGQTLLMAQKA